jgi:hypothetical protein
VDFRKGQTMKFVVLFVFAMIASSALAEGTSLGHGEGGRILDFLPIVQQYNASGELFRIQGVCKCTLFLGIYSGIATQKRRESRPSPCVASKVYLNLGNPQAGRFHRERLTVSLCANGQ